MTSKGPCPATIKVAHAKNDAIPTGPVGSGGPTVTHQCCGAADGRHAIHYCGCPIDWDSAGTIIKAPWITGKEGA